MMMIAVRKPVIDESKKCTKNVEEKYQVWAKGQTTASYAECFWPYSGHPHAWMLLGIIYIPGVVLYVELLASSRCRFDKRPRALPHPGVR